MKALFEGLFTVLKHLFIRPVTLEYPEKRRFQSNTFRGKPEVKLDSGGCVGCGICKKVCPSNAISFKKDENGRVISYSFDLNKCIFCGNCMYYCPHSAIQMTQTFELGTADKADLLLKYTGIDTGVNMGVNTGGNE